MPTPGVRVTVTFLGLVRDQVGTARLELDLPPHARMSDVREALAPLVQGKLGSWAWDEQKRDFTSRVTVARARGTTDKEGVLTDGEEIIVFPPMAGG